jgi:ABC-type nitrate/sulfonate/bicarbonate transport system permease component
VTPSKIDRTTIFLSVVLFLYLWDVAYFLGIRNPARFPHPFLAFRTLGDIEFLRGFTAMLREVIFSFVSGSVIGVAIGALVLYSSRLTQTMLHFLRLTLWFPMVFTAMAPFMLGLTAVILCSCYHYIAARSSLGLAAGEARTYAAREAILQALFVSLISQLWVEHWRWFGFSILVKPAMGLAVFATIAALIGFINWCFHSDFVLIANRHAATKAREINAEFWKSIIAFIIGTATCLVIWQLASAARFGFLQTSAYEALAAAYELFSGGHDIWGDIRLSLLEVAGGFVLGGSAALGIILFLSAKAAFRRLLFLLLPLTYISAIVVWLVIFTVWAYPADFSQRGFLYFWHKAIAAGCLTFFPVVESLWTLRERPLLCRILLAIDDALPIGFIAMVFGEAWAATQGLGFAITVANATGPSGKTLAGLLLVTFALMAGLSFTLRWIVKRLYLSVEMPQVFVA